MPNLNDHFFSFLIILLCFVSVAYGAGYTCPAYKRYTTCVAGYYLNGTEAGNSCTACSTANNTISTQNCTVECNVTNGTCSCQASAGRQTCNGKYTGGNAGGDGVAQCTGCTSWGPCVGCGTKMVSCDAGYYWDGATCAACGGNGYWCPGFTDVTDPGAGYGRNAVTAGYYSTGGTETTRTGQAQCTGTTYCTGGVQYECPDAETHKRTTFPDNYYNPTITRTELRTGNGQAAITDCFVLSWLVSPRGELYEYAYYNPETSLYDTNTSYGWADVSAGYYLTTKGMCGSYAYYQDIKECPAGSYCPGKEKVWCTSDNQATVHTETFGLEPCPAGTYSGTGAVSCSACVVGTYSGTGASSCSACTNAPTNSSYTGAGTSNTCPWECDSGYNLIIDGTCAQLCLAGITQIKLDGGISVPLYKSKQTVRAIGVGYANQVCYGNLAPGRATGAINVSIGGTIYHSVQ